MPGQLGNEKKTQHNILVYKTDIFFIFLLTVNIFNVVFVYLTVKEF